MKEKRKKKKNNILCVIILSIPCGKILVMWLQSKKVLALGMLL